MKASVPVGPAAELDAGTAYQPLNSGFSVDVLPDSLRQFVPFSDRQARFIADFQRITNQNEWPSICAMRALETRDARNDFVQRRREILDSSSISVLGVLRECQRRRTTRSSHQYL